MPHTMLRFPTVKARTGLSRSTIYLRISRGTFPAPVSLGGRAVGWIRGRGERVAHRADRATPADRAAAGAEDGGGGGRLPGAGTHTPSRRERVVAMIRNITVDGAEALAVDTAEELGRALLTGRYVVAGPTRCARSTGSRTPRTPTRRTSWTRRTGATTRGARRGGTDGVGPKDHRGADTRVEPGRLPQRVCRQAQRADRAGCRAVADTVTATA